MYEYCLGINPHFDKPAFQKVTIRPYLDKSGVVTSANGHYDSDYGTIAVDWAVADGIYTYTVTIPEAIEYDFDFPGMDVVSHKTEGEKHIFQLKAN